MKDAAPTVSADGRTDPAALADALLAGDRRALARAITLVESTRTDHREAAEALLAAIMPHSGRSIRIGITGVPGVGKSTFIESFGLHAIEAGHRLAVLAIDPTSRRTGGSILGDKTRMDALSRHPDAYIRPSPAGATLGGVARRTREAMLLCEAAGHDVVFVETVGVGQSETAVADMTDMFLLLLAPGGGDELQGLKKGIVELADLLVVNKADGDLKAAAGRAAADYRQALHLLVPASPDWTPEVLLCSAIEKTGLDEVWAAIGRFRETMTASGAFAARRAAQAGAAMWADLSDRLTEALRADPAVLAILPELERAVAAGEVPPSRAADRLIETFLGRSS